MNRIDARFEALRRQKRKALIGYVTAGFPDLKSLKALVPLLESAGLDLLEIGVPFSDPIADGPTIQYSSQVGLANGASLPWVLQTVAALRRRLELPILLMSYANPIDRMGVGPFFAAARRAGVDGLIVPDMIPEEASAFETAAERENVHLVYLVAPTTPEARARIIARRTHGFLYAVSLTGVTGARRSLAGGTAGFLKTLKSFSPRPVAVGFGISTPAQVRAVSPHVDGVIVGSALVKAIESSKGNAYRGAARFVQSLRRALDAGKEAYAS